MLVADLSRVGEDWVSMSLQSWLYVETPTVLAQCCTVAYMRLPKLPTLVADDMWYSIDSYPRVSRQFCLTIDILFEAAIKAEAVYCFLPPWLLKVLESAFAVFVHYQSQYDQWPTGQSREKEVGRTYAFPMHS